MRSKFTATLAAALLLAGVNTQTFAQGGGGGASRRRWGWGRRWRRRGNAGGPGGTGGMIGSTGTGGSATGAPGTGPSPGVNTCTSVKTTTNPNQLNSSRCGTAGAGRTANIGSSTAQNNAPGSQTPNSGISPNSPNSSTGTQGGINGSITGSPSGC